MEEELLHDDTATHIENMVQDFFRMPAQPITSHEEWLLRLCSQLMHREAAMHRKASSKNNQSTKK